MHVTIQLQPITAIKPQVALNEACDVARRIGCHVEVAVNGVPVRIGPTTPKDAVGEAARADAAQMNGRGDRV